MKTGEGEYKNERMDRRRGIAFFEIVEKKRDNF